MRKLLLLASLLLVVTFGSTVGADAEQPEVAAEVPTTVSLEMPGSIIDDVEVPNDILMFVQMKHQGYAVTKASKINR